MAKKVKFPLKLADGTQARDMDELYTHFDLVSVLGHYINGKLVEWLADRYYEEEADKINALDSSSSDFNKQLCEILGVRYTESETNVIDMTDIATRNERRERLRKSTADDEILTAVDSVAFSQEELAGLLDDEVNPIYLCGDVFTIPVSKGDTTYIGINNPVVNLSGSKHAINILLKNVNYGMGDFSKLLENTVEISDNITTLRASAERGDSNAQYKLGIFYIDGNGMNKDFDEGRKWLIKAAEQGLLEAKYRLGEYYANYDGIDDDEDEDEYEEYDKEAVRWYCEAAEQGMAEAQYHLADFYYYGRGIEEDKEEAIKWYCKAGKQGYVEALEFLVYNIDAEVNISEICNIVIEKGNAELLRILGREYENGIVIEQDLMEAANLYHIAFTKNPEGTIKSLGHIYRDDNGIIKQDFLRAIKFFRTVVEKYRSEWYILNGSLWNRIKFINMNYGDKNEVAQEVKEMLIFLRNFAEQGDMLSQKDLAGLYYDGYFVEKDYKESFTWYQKAAEQGDKDAEHMLAECEVHLSFKELGIDLDNIIKLVEEYPEITEKSYIDKPKVIDLSEFMKL